MNLAETLKFLGVVSAVDNRRADRNVAIVWQEILKDIPLRFALEAHTQFRREEPSVYLEPGHIYQRGKRMRESNRLSVESAKRHGLLDPSVDKDFVIEPDMVRVLAEYGQINDRSMVGSVGDEWANAALAKLRARWGEVYGALMPTVETVAKQKKALV